ncbi:unnamed protein product [Rotaria socialis]|uniref:Uncharacterized protein n=1 Tax=Rotaria socialis TaxID=392032 RepID=A0A820P2K7_9BILA|nr:unnamed protein product [Rotaria socialis]
MTHNKCHPISHEGDVDWIAHTVDEETTVITQHDYPPTNNIDSAPKDTYDLGHGSLQMLKKNQVTSFGITYATEDDLLIYDRVFPSDDVFGNILPIIIQDEIVFLPLQLMHMF